MSTTPSIRIHGQDISSVATRDGLSSSGGGRKNDEYSLPGWDRSEVEDTGTEAKKYSGDLRSKILADMQAAISEFKRAPADAEFYPMDSDLCVYAVQATAGFTRPTLIQNSGIKNLLYGSFEVISREPVIFGPRQGLLYAEDVALPTVSETLTNEGTEINTIDYLALSGAYDPLLGYSDDLALKFDSQELALCQQLMRNDLFELSRWGEVRHSYKVDWNRCYESMQLDLWGSDFCYGGSISGGLLTFAAGQIMFPFCGPLPISESPPPKLEFFLRAGDTPTVWRAFCRDLSDIAEVDVEIVKGYNTIEIPDCEGESFVAFGLKGDFAVSDLSATVQRYLAEFELPVIDIGDSFTISIEDGAYSNHSLTSLIAAYRNKYGW
jgi:hypothetical protein